MVWSGKTGSRQGLLPPLMIKALAFSLAVHLVAWLGFHFDVGRFFPLRRLFSSLPFFSATTKKPPIATPIENETQLIFVEVDPRFAAKEPPKDTQFYSAISTEAANTKVKAETKVPEIEGKQDEFLKVTENAKLKPQLVPSDEEQQKKDARPKEKKIIGDLALAKPQEKIQKENGKTDNEKGEADTPKHVRPKTIAEAKSGSPGEKSKITGGVPRVDLTASIAARGTVTGDYDWRIVESIRQCWYMQLEQISAQNPGKVVVEFRLHSDGSVSDLHVTHADVGDMQTLVCQLALTRPKFDKWPLEMKREQRWDFRDLTFSFLYGQ
jgi:hypothetical protein